MMSTQLRPGVGPGTYLVHWSTYDDGDSEVFAGCYIFFVGREAADAAVSQGRPLDGIDVCPANLPANQSTLNIDVKTSGNSATVNLKTENLTIKVPDGSPPQANVGHFHIYVDKLPVDALSGHSHEGESSSAQGSGGHQHSSEDKDGPVHWFENSYTIKNLAPGRHSVAVALFHDHSTAFSPPVIAEESFTIAGSGDGGGLSAWVAIVGVALALAVGLAAGKFVAARPAD
jgi:hypothetical protein